jgi:hypothetical protein
LGEIRPVGTKAHRPEALGGLVQRTNVWVPSIRGWAILSVAGLAGILTLLLCVQPFLAETHRVKSDVLVVEGWIPNYALQEGIVEFRAGAYRRLFTVGTEMLSGINLEEGDNYATSAAKRLAWLGLNPQLIQPVPCPSRHRDRTFASAAALKSWLDDHGREVTGLNVVTLGVHARRSRLLFQEALGNNIRVGVIAVEDRSYGPNGWWQYSEGVKEVIIEGVGYLYARLFFTPQKDNRAEVHERHKERNSG